jgi:hypothetical protein
MKYSLFISVIVFIFCSCADSAKKDLALLRATVYALDRSNNVISNASEDIRKDLNSKLADPRLANRALVWQPLADRVSKYSTSAINYIDTLKSQLLSAAGCTISNKAPAFESGNYRVVNRLFVKENKGSELLKVLLDFVDSIKNVDSEMNNDFSELFKMNYEYLDSENNKSETFNETYFNGVSAAGALVALAKFENDIRYTEKEALTFCSNKCSPGCILIYEKFQVIVGQSSNYVKAGDEIDITAGVGAFSISASPEFIVDGEKIKANQDGIMIYKFKTQHKAGTYRKPVTIEYTKPDGTRNSHTYTISYTVIEPNQK